MSEDQSSVVTLKVRVTPEFREKITETAKSNNRSMNQEIVDRLEKSFEPELKVTETLEFELMKQSYLDQAKQIKELKEALPAKLITAGGV